MDFASINSQNHLERENCAAHAKNVKLGRVRVKEKEKEKINHQHTFASD